MYLVRCLPYSLALEGPKVRPKYVVGVKDVLSGDIAVKDSPLVG